MKILQKKIFNKNIKFEIRSSNKELNFAIDEQLSHYPDYPNNEHESIFVEISNDFSINEFIAKNPSVHIETKNGFIAYYTNFYVAYSFNKNILQIKLNIKPSGGKITALLRKINNMEYATREDRAAQILFESVLIPATFFDSNLFIVHSSGLNKNGSGILIGGTGGGGKTSLELELSFNRGFSFVNDDIAVLNSDGEIFPNLAHPKIYGYNLTAFPKLKKSLFSGRAFDDILHWKIKYYVNGIDKVRRRLNIKNLGYGNSSVPLKYYFILFREKREDILFEKIDCETAAEMNSDIIATEYFEFLNHVRWHQFNSKAINGKPIITVDIILEQIKENSLRAFSKSENYLVRIPYNLPHNIFLDKTAKQISEICCG